MATPRIYNCDVRHLGSSVDPDVQRKSRVGSNQYRWPLRGAVLDQWHMLVDLLGHAGRTGYQYPARSLATRRHLLWGVLLRHWSGDPLRLQ